MMAFVTMETRIDTLRPCGASTPQSVCVSPELSVCASMCVCVCVEQEGRIKTEEVTYVLT